MIVKTNYHGDIQIKEDDIVTVVGGMLGYEDMEKFVIIKDEDIFVEFLQNIDEQVAFAVMDPFMAKPDYSLNIPENIIHILGIDSPEDVVIKTVVVIPDDISKIRTNLQAPIVFNKKNNRGVQIVLDDTYPMRYEFYDKEDKQ